MTLKSYESSKFMNSRKAHLIENYGLQKIISDFNGHSELQKSHPRLHRSFWISKKFFWTSKMSKGHSGLQKFIPDFKRSFLILKVIPDLKKFILDTKKIMNLMVVCTVEKFWMWEKCTNIVPWKLPNQTGNWNLDIVCVKNFNSSNIS